MGSWNQVYRRCSEIKFFFESHKTWLKLFFFHLIVTFFFIILYFEKMTVRLQMKLAPIFLNAWNQILHWKKYSLVWTLVLLFFFEKIQNLDNSSCRRVSSRRQVSKINIRIVESKFDFGKCLFVFAHFLSVFLEKLFNFRMWI